VPGCQLPDGHHLAVELENQLSDLYTTEPSVGIVIPLQTLIREKKRKCFDHIFVSFGIKLLTEPNVANKAEEALPLFLCKTKLEISYHAN